MSATIKRDPKYHAFELLTFEAMHVQSYTEARYLRRVIMESRGAVWRGQTLEQSPHVLKIRRLHLKTRYSDPNYLDAVFLLSTYERA